MNANGSKSGILHDAGHIIIETCVVCVHTDGYFSSECDNVVNVGEVSIFNSVYPDVGVPGVLCNRIYIVEESGRVGVYVNGDICDIIREGVHLTNKFVRVCCNRDNNVVNIVDDPLHVLPESGVVSTNTDENVVQSVNNSAYFALKAAILGMNAYVSITDNCWHKIVLSSTKGLPVQDTHLQLVQCSSGGIRLDQEPCPRTGSH